MYLQVNIHEISLNEEVLKPTPSDHLEAQKLESIGENEDEHLSRSEPNIQSEIRNEELDTLGESLSQLSLSDEDLACKRADSEPVIHHSVTKIG